MNRRQVIMGAALALAPRSLPAADAPRQIAFLFPFSPHDTVNAGRVSHFEQGLAARGWFVGKNIEVTYRFTDDLETLKQLAKELVDRKPEVIVASTNVPLKPLREATTTIPIVFVHMSDPVRLGIVKNVTKPEGNITGFSNYVASIFKKQFDILHQVVPTAKHIGAVYNPDTFDASLMTPEQDNLDMVKLAAAERGTDIEELKVHSAAEIQSKIEDFLKKPDAALFVMSDAFTSSNRLPIISSANRSRIATMYPHPYFVADGGLMSYGIDTFNLYFECADYVDRILKGAVPAELPIRYPDKFFFAVNQKTATTLKLEIPSLLLFAADQVVE